MKKAKNWVAVLALAMLLPAVSVVLGVNDTSQNVIEEACADTPAGCTCVKAQPHDWCCPDSGCEDHEECNN